MVTALMELNYIKILDPTLWIQNVYGNDILMKLERVAEIANYYAERTHILFSGGYSTDLITYTMSLRMRALAKEAAFVQECIQEFDGDKANYFRKVMRMDTCNFWHTFHQQRDIIYLNQCSEILFTVDFMFNVIKMNKLLSALNNVEIFLGKIYGTQASLNPFVVDYTTPCKECIVNDRKNYVKDSHFQYASCLHMYKLCDVSGYNTGFSARDTKAGEEENLPATIDVEMDISATACTDAGRFYERLSREEYNFKNSNCYQSYKNITDKAISVTKDIASP
jgi:hypothetical protein